MIRYNFLGFFLLMVVFSWLVICFPAQLQAQERSRTVVMDRTLSISYGSTEVESSRFFEGDVLDLSGNKIIVFTVVLIAKESPNFKDFTKLYCKIDTHDLRKKPKYSFEDVQAGRVSMREWANQPDMPRESHEKMLSLPRPAVIQKLAALNATPLSTLYETEDFQVSIELLSAEIGENSRLFRDLTFRILIEGPQRQAKVVQSQH